MSQLPTDQRRSIKDLRKMFEASMTTDMAKSTPDLSRGSKLKINSVSENPAWSVEKQSTAQTRKITCTVNPSIRNTKGGKSHKQLFTSDTHAGYQRRQTLYEGPAPARTRKLSSESKPNNKNTRSKSVPRCFSTADERTLWQTEELRFESIDKNQKQNKRTEKDVYHTKTNHKNRNYIDQDDETSNSENDQTDQLYDKNTQNCDSMHEHRETRRKPNTTPGNRGRSSSCSRSRTNEPNSREQARTWRPRRSNERKKDNNLIQASVNSKIDNHTEYVDTALSCPLIIIGHVESDSEDLYKSDFNTRTNVNPPSHGLDILENGNPDDSDCSEELYFIKSGTSLAPYLDSESECSDYNGATHSDYDITRDEVSSEHTLQMREPRDYKKLNTNVRKPNKNTDIPTQSKCKSINQEEECIVVNEIEKRQNDRKKKRRLSNHCTEQDMQQIQKHSNKRLSNRKALTEVPQRDHQTTPTRPISSAAIKHVSFQDIFNSRKVPEGIGSEKFSTLQRMLKEKFGGVIAHRRSITNNGRARDNNRKQIPSVFVQEVNRSKLADNKIVHEKEKPCVHKMEYPVITHDAHAQPQKVSLPEEAIDRGRHSVFQEQIEEQSQDVDQQENQIIHYNQDELSDDSFLDYDTEPEDKETTSQTVHPHDRFNVHVDPMYDDNVYEEPYVVFSAFNDNTLVPTTTKERKGQKSFKKRFGALSFARRRKSSQLPSEQTGGKTEFDIEACCDSREIYANVNRDVQTTETLFKEFVDFVSKCLEDLNALNSRYVTNAALNPQNGILQDGEYRRLFARIPKLIQFLDDLLDDLKKCKPLNDSLICQLLLDVVTTDFLNAFQDYTVNSRFQEFTLSYLRKRRIAFNQIVKSQEKTVDICSSACRHHTLDGLLKQPCYFLQQLNLYIKRLQGIIKKTNNPEANVVRLAHDLTQNMNAIVNECEEQDNKLQEREERHVSKILLRMHFRHSDSVISSEEIQISNESWVESWNDVIVFSCKKSDGKDWKKAGSNVKLVIFERVVMVINEKQHKSDGQNGVYYKLIDCANKNFVEVEKPSSDTYPFKIPTRKGLTMNVFLIVMHNDTCPERRLYYVCWEPSQKRSFEIWRKHLTVPSGDSGEQYASWSRPKYKIVEHFLGTERGELRVNLGDEVEITEKADGWVRAVHLGNNNQGWIPKSCLGDLIPSMFTRGMNIRQQRRIRNDGHTHHSVIIRKDKKGNKHDRKK